ncbi:MAG: MobC family plasmid mobilization relaxosome protein [Burkholderiaceae bacterium]|jgi:hypothetical protein|nr:MobC family plasmid mobilization relaxosome protein [Burkholderiaceae bacterium]
MQSPTDSPFPEALDTILPIRIGQKARARFRELARQSGKTESQYARQMIYEAIAKANNAGQTPEPTTLPTLSPEETRPCRIAIRLPRFLLLKAKARAGQKGMSTNRWIAALIQSNMLNIPVMTETEVAILRESNYQLMAIGRNINQITRALNTGEPDKDTPAILLRLKQHLSRTETHISELVSASRNSWRVNDAA